MAFPTSNVSIANLSSNTANPAVARVDLLDAVQKLNTIIDEANTAQGVVTLDTSGYIRTEQIPNTITANGTQVLNPSTSIVNIQSILRISTLTDTQITALTGSVIGDVVICSNVTAYSTAFLSGNAAPGLVFYTGGGTGTGWYSLQFDALYELP